MAKKHSTRSKARKPKLIEVDGHILTPAMFSTYEGCIESQKRTNSKQLDAESIARRDTLKGVARGAATIPPQDPETEALEERTSVRIRAFLARTRPLSGNDVSDLYWDGRQLVEQLALSHEVGSELHWDPAQCADVLFFLHSVEPVKGTCFCNDPSDVNATCGFHAILNFMEDELRALGRSVKTPKRKEASHV